MTRVVGYTRELFVGADTSSDAEELRQAGATQVFSDAASASPRLRPELGVCLRSLGTGDMLVVSSSARLSHSLGHFVSTMDDLAVAGVLFRSLTEPALATGFGPSEDRAQVWAALRGLQRRLKSLGTRAGMSVAAAEGRHAGRPTVMTDDRIAIAQELRNQGRSFTHIGRVLGVSTSAVQRALTPRPDHADR